MNKTEKVKNRENELKKYLKNNKFKNRDEIFKYYKKDIEEYNRNKKTDDQIKIPSFQTINGDLKRLEVELDEDTGYLLLPSQVQINNYKKILGNILKLGNYKISPSIEIINLQTNDSTNEDGKQSNEEKQDSQLKSLYKIILFCDDTGIDIINSIIYKCFPNIDILGSTVGSKVLEVYFNSKNDSDTFLDEINALTNSNPRRKCKKKGNVK